MDLSEIDRLIHEAQDLRKHPNPQVLFPVLRKVTDISLGAANYLLQAGRMNVDEAVISMESLTPEGVVSTFYKNNIPPGG